MAIDEVQGVSEEAKEEARGMLDKLRGAAGTAATSAAGSAGGTLLGSLLKEIFGLGA